MSNPQTPPPDQLQREQALNPAASILVQAPAGSGKTDLLTRRFLCLLAEVEDPAQIVAITFTKAAAAEMSHRILSKLEAAAAHADADPNPDPFSMEFLARRALQHAEALNWNLLDQPAQLRISTIDSFCRDLALQQPLLSGLGDGLGIYEQPEELYRRAARQALEQIDGADPTLRSAIESLLLWRDNNWQEMETELAKMLANRDRWMHDFVLGREQDWEALRASLERPFARAVQQSLATLSNLLDQVPGSRDEALTLARFACEQGAASRFQSLAELADFPSGNLTDPDALEEARQAYCCLADLLLTLDGSFRKQVTKTIGFPSERKREKTQILDLIARLAALESALAAVRSLPPARYTDEDWQIVRACFTLLRNAAGQLKVVFAEAGAVDYVEVAQIALSVLQGPDGLPTDAAISVADGIHHILVDEFQDTSRRQHELLRRLIAAWPDREGRSCFVVGDPMQSIYFFRDADAELFPRVREVGLEIPSTDPLLFEPVGLTANFRSARPLVENLNEVFEKVFAANDGSGVTFSKADPARNDAPAAIILLPEGAAEVSPGQAERSPGDASRFRTPSPVGAAERPAESSSNFMLHINFVPQTSRNKSVPPDSEGDVNHSQSAQIEEIVSLIRSHIGQIDAARAKGDKYRIAVLGRTRNALAPIAQALREAQIPFRAVDLEKLSARPEVLDALALARALLNPLDRVSWLGILRAPWCGLSLADLHALTSADAPDLLARPVPELLSERLALLSEDGRLAADRVLDVLAAAPSLRFAQPATSLGAWLQQVWLRLGGAHCVDAAARANLDLLWQSLDGLRNGEQDLLGPALNAALENLTAQPDPAVSSDCGVQLMTIHKSKGLEFEVVLVPELQAGSRVGELKMLSWLERGLPPDETAAPYGEQHEITEFLVAPLQSKGAGKGTTKQWVDRIYRDRESQEMRRILYVAATRAREELHLFAQPACKQDKTGSWQLAEPKNSLLSTAWPALAAEVQQQFEAWKSTLTEPQAEPATLESLAASAESNLLVMPSPLKPTLIRRLPPNYLSTQATTYSFVPEPIMGAPGPDSGTWEFTLHQPGALGLTSGTWDDKLYHRHEGGLLSRALGIAVHALLEQLAHLRKSNDWDAARAALKHFEPRTAAQIRSAGIDPHKATTLAEEAMRIALDASREPAGNWILSPHPQDAAEARWTGVTAAGIRTVQVDRLFRASLDPLSTGNQAWWIIDYKTAHADSPDATAALPQLRALFAPQLAAYADVLRKLHGTDAPIRAGLYYPRMLLFDWWEI
jgi:ATP-dependent exoDNAse (exonuclease V) beta subunit